jgi:hypothetical protein
MVTTPTPTAQPERVTHSHERELPRPWPVGALYYIWDTPEGRGCRVALDEDLWASVDSLPAARRAELLKKVAASWTSEQLDAEKAKRGHEIEKRLSVEDERDRLREAAKEQGRNACAIFDGLKAEQIAHAETRKQLAEARDAAAVLRLRKALQAAQPAKGEQPSMATHVKYTMTCEHCKNSSTHAAFGSDVGAHAVRYYEHHKNCAGFKPGEPVETVIGHEPKVIGVVKWAGSGEHGTVGVECSDGSEWDFEKKHLRLRKAEEAADPAAADQPEQPHADEQEQRLRAVSGFIAIALAEPKNALESLDALADGLGQVVAYLRAERTDAKQPAPPVSDPPSVGTAGSRFEARAKAAGELTATVLATSSAREEPASERIQSPCAHCGHPEHGDRLCHRPLSGQDTTQAHYVCACKGEQHGRIRRIQGSGEAGQLCSAPGKEEAPRGPQEFPYSQATREASGRNGAEEGAIARPQAGDDGPGLDQVGEQKVVEHRERPSDEELERIGAWSTYNGALTTTVGHLRSVYEFGYARGLAAGGKADK